MIKEIGNVREAEISILAEDTIAYDTPFKGKFGLSILLELKTETFEKTILYDTNSDAEPIIHNMKILGKSFDKISTIFLSHCHYDHTDGLMGILEVLNRHVYVVAHSDIFRTCLEINSDGIRDIGMAYPKSKYEEKGAIFKLSRTPLNVMTGVITSGEIERVTSFEHREDLYTIVKGEVIQDHENDDMAIILNFKEGLVIVTGCCHSGIVNTIKHAKKITGREKIYAVVGGLHLVDADKEKIEKSAEALKEVEWVFAGHCTGLNGLIKIKSILGERFVQIHTGSIIHLPVTNDNLPTMTISTSKRDMNRTVYVKDSNESSGNNIIL